MSTRSEVNTTINMVVGNVFSMALGVVFIVLKLTDVIDWSWWWVLGPFWIPTVLSLVLFVGALAVFAFMDRKRA